MYGSAPTGQHLMEVGLSRPPYLPQTVSKEQSSRKGGKRGGVVGGGEPQVKKPQDCCWCQTHTAGVTQPEPSPWQEERRLFRFPSAAFISSQLCIVFLNKMFILIKRPGSNIKVPPINGGILELLYANLTINCRIVWQIPVNVRRSSPKTQMQIPPDRS